MDSLEREISDLEAMLPGNESSLMDLPVIDATAVTIMSEQAKADPSRHIGCSSLGSWLTFNRIAR
jgi:hypothetical protein